MHRLLSLSQVAVHLIRIRFIRTLFTFCFGVVLTACTGAGQPTIAPPSTRTPAPTFTLAENVISVITVVPSVSQTPGVIVVPPGVDPRTLIPIPPTGTYTVTPTPTPSATMTDTPASSSTPTATKAGDQAASPLTTPSPTMTLTPIPTFTLVPTSTSTPTETPTQTPTPYVQVSSGLVNLRAGPGIGYPLVAQLGPDIPVAIVGQNPESTWYQICCVNGDSVWVAKTHIHSINDSSFVPLVIESAPPAPTVTNTPTQTPTITPTPTVTPYPFEVSWGPLYFPTNNTPLQIWAKLEGPAGEPLSGHYLQVNYRHREDRSTFERRPNTKGEAPSTDYFDYNVPPGPGSGNRVEYNYKYEYFPPDPLVEDTNTLLTRLDLIDGYWQIYVVDAAGNQLSEPVEFNTLKNNNNREVYVAWRRTH